MDYTRKRKRILAASCLINLCIGSVYAWSVFATPLAEHLGALQGATLTAADLTIVFVICNAYGPVPQILGGFLIKRFGPRVLLLISGLLFGGGMLLCSVAQSMAMLIIGYGLFVGMGVGLAYGCTINNSIKFYPDKRGLVGGIATASYGFSSVLMAVVANAMISAMGIVVTFRCIGILFAIIICVCGLFVERCPDHFMPEGFGGAKNDAVADKQDKNWNEVLRDPIFYVMLALFTCGAFLGMMVISQASPIAQTVAGLTAGAASVAVSVLALFNMAGRIVCGYVSDKIGRINTLMIMLAVAIVGLCLLYFLGSLASVFYIGICLVGLAYGAFLGIYPGFTADQFGAKYNTTNYALIFIGMAIAGIMGPIVASRIYQMSGSYTPAFLCAIAVAIVGVLLTVLYRRYSRQA